MSWPVATVVCFALALLFSYRINTRPTDRTPHSRELGPPPDARKPVMDSDTWAKDQRRRIEEREAERRAEWKNSATHRDIRRRWQIDHAEAGHTNRMQTWWGKEFD